MGDGRWLSLKKAAELLDVHPSTLRRWADSGAIGVMLTPGGHRRFDANEIGQFAQSQRVRSTVALQETWKEKAIANSRQEARESDADWMQMQNDASRLQHRQLGKRLVGLVMQYVAVDDDADADLLGEAQEIGTDYARVGLSVGMKLTDMLNASMMFHDTMLETSLELPEKARVKPETNRRLLKRINQLLNTVHLAIAHHYETHDYTSR